MVCENLIVYCADRIRCFPGEKTQPGSKTLTYGSALGDAAFGNADGAHAGKSKPLSPLSTSYSQ